MAIAATGRFEITYLNAKEKFTKRVINVSLIGMAGGRKYVFGYCEFRKEERIFRDDRVDYCFDMDSGEECCSIYDYLDWKSNIEKTGMQNINLLDI